MLLSRFSNPPFFRVFLVFVVAAAASAPNKNSDNLFLAFSSFFQFFCFQKKLFYSFILSNFGAVENFILKSSIVFFVLSNLRCLFCYQIDIFLVVLWVHLFRVYTYLLWDYLFSIWFLKILYTNLIFRVITIAKKSNSYQTWKTGTNNN